MVAVNEAMKVNSCLKVMVGSQLLGSLDYGIHGSQHRIDPERAKAIEAILPLRYIEGKLGSVLFFHCNL